MWAVAVGLETVIVVCTASMKIYLYYITLVQAIHYHYNHSSRNFPVTWLISLAGPSLSPLARQQRSNQNSPTCNSQDCPRTRRDLRSSAVPCENFINAKSNLIQLTRLEWNEHTDSISVPALVMIAVRAHLHTAALLSSDCRGVQLTV